MNLDKVVREAVEKQLKEEAERIFEEAKDTMVKRLEQRKNEIVSGVVLSIMQHYRAETMGENLTITVFSKEAK